jgi:DNA-binding transcriptional ArsR family regulator
MGFDKAKVRRKEVCTRRAVHLDRVSRAEKESIRDSEVDRVSQTFKILGDPNRIRILAALSGGEMCVCDLASYLGVSVSAVSHQLRRLKDMALVRYRRDGQVLYYVLDDKHVADLLEVGLAHVRE